MKNNKNGLKEKLGGVNKMTFENLTFEEWQTALTEKYQNLYKTVNELIPELWDPFRICHINTKNSKYKKLLFTVCRYTTRCSKFTKNHNSGIIQKFKK